MRAIVAGKAASYRLKPQLQHAANWPSLSSPQRRHFHGSLGLSSTTSSLISCCARSKSRSLIIHSCGQTSTNGISPMIEPRC